MRKIAPSQILLFIVLFGLAVAAAIFTARLALRPLELGEYRALTTVALVVLLLYAYALMLYRILLAVAPLREGEVAEGSGQEFVYHVYLLFFLTLFYPVIYSGLVPMPLMRLLYQALGARFGPNTYGSGILFDPPFVRFGGNCIIGHYSMLVPHVIEGRRLAHYPIVVGNNVTIGAGSVVLSGVTIGDDAIVSTGAVVTKGTRIAPGEIWGGVPARCLGSRAAEADAAGAPVEGKVSRRA